MKSDSNVGSAVHAQRASATADTSAHRTNAVTAGDDPVARLSAAQLRVVNLFDPDEGPVSIHTLAQRSGQHPNTLREHLQALIEYGLVHTSTGVPSGRGRPPLLYQAVPLEQVRPQARAYGLLTTALAEHIERNADDPVAEALESGRRAGAQLASSGQVRTPTSGSSVDVLVNVLTHLGFDPRADGTVVRLGICPFLQAATTVPGVICNVHKGLLHGYFEAIGDRSRLELHAFTDNRVCEVHLPDNPEKSH